MSVAIPSHIHSHSHHRIHHGSGLLQTTKDQTDDIEQSLMTLILQALQKAGVDVNTHPEKNDVGAAGASQGISGKSGKSADSGRLLEKLQDLLELVQELLAKADPNQTNDTAAGVADALGGTEQDALGDMGAGDAGAPSAPGQNTPADMSVRDAGHHHARHDVAEGADHGSSQGATPSTAKPAAAAPPPASEVAASTGHTGPVKANALPPMNGEKIVNETIVVKAGTVFDGHGMHFKAGPKLGDGGQGESQKPVFELEPGAQLKNVQVSGADGVHAKGDAKLDNVWWRDVGEDAFTMKGPGKVEVNGGGAFNATDKIFQLNHGGSFSLNNFTADTFGKAVRTNGGKDFPIDISVTNSSFNNGKEAIVRSDATQARIHLENNQIGNTKFDVIAPESAAVTGATQRGQKAYTG